MIIHEILKFLLNFIGIMIFYYLAGVVNIKTFKEWLIIVSTVTIATLLIKYN